jgi:uncharacterized RDD family membrane protein YckC
MLFLEGTLLAGVDASAAQNLPVTKTCSQCGAVLPSSVRVCHFCDSSFSVGFSLLEESPDTYARENLAPEVMPDPQAARKSSHPSSATQQVEQDAAWRGELSQRLKAYRTRRGKYASNVSQARFSFDGPAEKPAQKTSLSLKELPASPEGDFSFTIAIGRPTKKQVVDESRMMIDVSLRPETENQAQVITEQVTSQPGLYTVASMDDRRLAAIIDLCCLLFAYGGFLVLFGSLGGNFTLSKLSAAVYATTFAIVYLQYFALFTIFGGTTPGMMMRGLQVTSFSGEPPTPKQLLLRSAGYLLSAGTFFLGFLWAMWDEDELTWHDRLSRTYLSATEAFADIETSSPAHGR